MRAPAPRADLYVTPRKLCHTEAVIAGGGWGNSGSQEYSGACLRPILIGIDGRVYNVWRNRQMYGVDGSYEEPAARRR